MKKILVFENLFEYLSSVNKPNYISTSTDDLYKSEIDSDKVEQMRDIKFHDKSEINSDEIEQTEDKTEFIERPLKQSAYNLILNLFKSNPDKWFTRKELYDQFERKGYGRPDGTFHNATIEDALKRLTQKSKTIKQIKFNEKSKRNATMWKLLSDNNTKTMKLLKWIGSKSNGATFTEIQHYIFVVLNGNSEEDFWKKDINGLRQTRGYWATALYGASDYHGILPRFCKKINGKWVLDKLPKDDETLYPSIRF